MGVAPLDRKWCWLRNQTVPGNRTRRLLLGKVLLWRGAGRRRCACHGQQTCSDGRHLPRVMCSEHLAEALKLLHRNKGAEEPAEGQNVRLLSPCMTSKSRSRWPSKARTFCTPPLQPQASGRGDPGAAAPERCTSRGEAATVPPPGVPWARKHWQRKHAGETVRAAYEACQILQHHYVVKATHLLPHISLANCIQVERCRSSKLHLGRGKSPGAGQIRLDRRMAASERLES